MNYEIVKTNDGVLEVKDFDKVVSLIKKELDSYVCFVAQDQNDYKAIKETRAELNKMAKAINDAKIDAVSDLTSNIVNQTKEIISLINTKSAEFDLEAKDYEAKVLNKEVKQKSAFEIVIKCVDRKAVEDMRKKLDKIKVDYIVKEK